MRTGVTDCKNLRDVWLGSNKQQNGRYDERQRGAKDREVRKKGEKEGYSERGRASEGERASQ